jgi:hypothetical protein
MLQPQGANRHAVFFSHAGEVLTRHYERAPEHPRIGHTLTLDVDRFGNVLNSADVGYGREESSLTEEWDQRQQMQTLVTYTETQTFDVLNRMASSTDSLGKTTTYHHNSRNFLSKTVDYSVFRAAKEVLYIPLPFTARYRAKLTIDALIYRSTKGVASALLSLAALVAGVLPLRLHPLLAVALGGFWHGVSRGLPEPQGENSSASS